VKLPLRILQVEDSESDAALIVRHMERAGYDVYTHRVEDAEAMRAALQSGEWDVVISDHRMRQFDAPGALMILQESGRDIPFLVVSGTISQELAIGMMKSGAHDYLVKGDLTRLAPAVEREIRDAKTRHRRRQAEIALHESQERLSIAVDATQLGTFDYHPRTGKLIWSDACRRHLGLHAETEPTIEQYRAAIHPDDRQRYDAVIRACVQAGNPRFTIDFRAIGIDDHVERFLSIWGHIFFDHGEPVRFIGVTLDITDRKHLEAQFRQAQKLESIGRLAGGVAHDFNNLLTVITGYADMSMADLPADHPVRDSLAEISAAAARAGDLTRQLLAFSRRQASHPQPVDINSLLQNLRKMLAPLLGETVELTLSLDPAAGVFLADPGQIEQIVMNLAVNSRDALPDGGKLIIETSHIYADAGFTQAHLSVTEGPYVVVSISDTGIGMTEEVRAHIFEPFFTTKEPGKGTGLGLSTVWGIVQQCSGFISVYSEPGRGTTFRILFPAARQTDSVVAQPQPTQGLSGDEVILLAEDEAGVRKYVRQILERHGYRVLVAANGHEALKLAQDCPEKIDLLLTDVVMPQMGGAELAAKFAAMRRGVQIICMSGYSERLWPEAKASGNFLQKPFTPDQLLRQIRTVLEQR